MCQRLTRSKITPTLVFGIGLLVLSIRLRLLQQAMELSMFFQKKYIRLILEQIKSVDKATCINRFETHHDGRTVYVDIYSFMSWNVLCHMKDVLQVRSCMGNKHFIFKSFSAVQQEMTYNDDAADMNFYPIRTSLLNVWDKSQHSMIMSRQTVGGYLPYESDMMSTCSYAYLYTGLPILFINW